jgi:tRNA threonylcarbamoyladenosine biosynthesis protein TsaB
MLLALECSAATRSIALSDAGRVLATRRHPEVRQTSLFSLIQDALNEIGASREAITGVAIGLGPGSYTGIRAAIAIAQGWELATQVRLQGISSVEVCAHQCRADGVWGDVAVVIDAQRQECYLAEFRISSESCAPLAPLRLVSRSEVRSRAEAGLLLAGPELEVQGLDGRRVVPDAAALAAMASTQTEFVPGDRLIPIYLRPTAFVKAVPPRVET